MRDRPLHERDAEMVELRKPVTKRKYILDVFKFDQKPA